NPFAVPIFDENTLKDKSIIHNLLKWHKMVARFPNKQISHLTEHAYDIPFNKTRLLILYPKIFNVISVNVIAKSL
ncbi:MAG: hypothetical protein ABGW81_01800, partial [Paracoccaceae bacterium]